MNQWKTVFSFHLKENITSKMFIIMSFVLFSLVLGFFGLTNYLKGEDSILHVHVVNDTPLLFSFDSFSEDVVVTEIDASDVKESEALVKEGDIEGIFLLENVEGVPHITYIAEASPDPSLQGFMEQIVQHQYTQHIIAQQELPAALAQELAHKVQTSYSSLQETNSVGLVYFFVIIMYMFIIVFGQTVGMGIAGEKSSRVMEVMITKVKPMIMMYAKIAASLVSGLLQILVVFCAYFLANAIGWTGGDSLHLFGMPLDLSVITVPLFLYFLLYFILGFTLYAFLFASFSSVINRLEDIGSVIFPISLVLMMGFILGIRTMVDPSSTLVVYGSYVPLFSPMVTLPRIIFGEANTWEIIATSLIMVGAILLVAQYANKLYLKGVMKYSGNVSVKDVWVKKG